MRVVKIAYVILALALAVVVAGVITQPTHPTARPRVVAPTAPATASVEPAPVEAASTAITEDDPRWDCASMGNHVCGPRLRVIFDNDAGSARVLRSRISDVHGCQPTHYCLARLEGEPLFVWVSVGDAQALAGQ